MAQHLHYPVQLQREFGWINYERKCSKILWKNTFTHFRWETWYFPSSIFPSDTKCHNIDIWTVEAITIPPWGRKTNIFVILFGPWYHLYFENLNGFRPLTSLFDIKALNYIHTEHRVTRHTKQTNEKCDKLQLKMPSFFLFASFPLSVSPYVLVSFVNSFYWISYYVHSLLIMMKTCLFTNSLLCPINRVFFLVNLLWSFHCEYVLRVPFTSSMDFR